MHDLPKQSSLQWSQPSPRVWGGEEGSRCLQQVLRLSRGDQYLQEPAAADLVSSTNSSSSAVCWHHLLLLTKPLTMLNIHMSSCFCLCRWRELNTTTHWLDVERVVRPLSQS